MEKASRVEVAVAFTDGTWLTTITQVENFPTDMIEKAAEDKVLEDFSAGPRPVAFVKAIWIDPDEE